MISHFTAGKCARKENETSEERETRLQRMRTNHHAKIAVETRGERNNITEEKHQPTRMVGMQLKPPRKEN